MEIQNLQGILMFVTLSIYTQCKYHIIYKGVLYGSQIIFIILLIYDTFSSLTSSFSYPLFIIYEKSHVTMSQTWVASSCKSA